MKRLMILVVLVALAGVFTGCNQQSDTPKAPDTNAVPAAPSTNK